MKKIYMAPASQEIEINTSGMLCTSLENIGNVTEPLAPELPPVPGMGGITDLPPLVNLPGFTD